MISVDLNCDLGESFGAYTIGMDEAVIPLITSANVACGYHAGDPLVMAKTVERCRTAGVHVGAHPGFPDLMGFGRRNMNVSPAEAKAYIQYQLGALLAFCRASGVSMHHVKPHGALYNMAAKDEKLARAIVEGICEVDDRLTLLALSGSEMLPCRRKSGASRRQRGLCRPRLSGKRNACAAQSARRDDYRRKRSDCPRRAHGHGGRCHIHRRH